MSVGTVKNGKTTIKYFGKDKETATKYYNDLKDKDCIRFICIEYDVIEECWYVATLCKR